MPLLISVGNDSECARRWKQVSCKQDSRACAGDHARDRLNRVEQDWTDLTAVCGLYPMAINPIDRRYVQIDMSACIVAFNRRRIIADNLLINVLRICKHNINRKLGAFISCIWENEIDQISVFALWLWLCGFWLSGFAKHRYAIPFLGDN